MKRRSPPRKRNPQRKAREFQRAYGGEARVTWVQSLPCCVCGGTPSENAHITTGGMGRKADADQVVPLCAGMEGCHAELHRAGRETFERTTGVSLASVAANIQAAWERREER